MDDNQLMARVAEDDWDALATLLGRHERPLFAFFYRLGCAPSAVDDLVQEVMIRVYGERRRYNTARPFAPWLYGIARHVWQDYARRQRREVWAAVGLAPAEHVQWVAPDPLERSGQREEADKVRRRLDRLPEEQRMTLILRHYHGLSYGEIAEALALPLGTVKWRIHEAMRKLTQWFGVRGPEGTRK